MHSLILPSVFLPVLAYATPLDLRSDASDSLLSSSFTWNDKCGASVACGPSMAGVHGQGTTAANNVTFAAGKPITNGQGAGCGQCWHLQATNDPFPTNGKTWGTPVVAMINDQCTDGGYCDQTESRQVNTGYGKQVHFDLCGETGTAQQFFGDLGMGVLTGYAKQVDCSMLSKGTQGSDAGNLVPASGGGSPPAKGKSQSTGSAVVGTAGTASATGGSLATSSLAAGAGGSPAATPEPQLEQKQGQQQQQPQGQQGTDQSHGSMNGLEAAGRKAASGGEEATKKAMSDYMQQALAGNAPDEGVDDTCEE